MSNAGKGLSNLVAMEALIATSLVIHEAPAPVFMAIMVAAGFCGLALIVYFGRECVGLPVLYRYVMPSSKKRLV